MTSSALVLEDHLAVHRPLILSRSVAATMMAAHACGIRVFATGGIGGVHRNVADTGDVSSDLTALGRVPVAVVCSGAKAVLDLPRTLETLETLGVDGWREGMRTGVTTAHPHFDAEAREGVNYVSELGPSSSYALYAQTPGSSERRRFASIPVKRPAYMHSFALTPRWACLVEFPLRVNPLRLALGPELLDHLFPNEDVKLVTPTSTWASPRAILAVTDRRLLWLLDDAPVARVHSLTFRNVAEIKRRIAAEEHDLYLLDEFTYPVNWGWIDLDDVLDTLAARPGHQHVVITGRRADPRLVEAADLVTEMTKVKHPMDAGQKGQKGIEW